MASLKNVWMLSQFYVDDTGDTHDQSQIHPVAHDYAEHDFCPVRPVDPNGWALVLVATDTERIGLAKQDPRIVYVGTPWNKTPQQVLDTYATQLAGDTFANFGEVLLKLAETEPLYHPE